MSDGIPGEGRIERQGETPRHAYLFDVDGVLTNPQTKRIEEPALLQEIIKRLARNEPVCLNTGRSIAFMENILTQIEPQLEPRARKNLFTAAEKGAASIVYDDSGSRITRVDESMRIPEQIQEEARALAASAPYTETMFYDETKQTMVSIELKDPQHLKERSFEDFKKAQVQLVQGLRRIVERHGLQHSLRVVPARIATDVENIRAGKSLGARAFVAYLKERNIAPRTFVSFGDDVQDLDMHEELRALGKDSQFVFVGDREQIAGRSVEGIYFTEQPVDKGTLEFLQKETP